VKRLIAAAGLALATASTAACGGTHTSSPATVTVTTTPAQSAVITTPAHSVTPVTPVMPPAEMRQWVNAGQLDFYVYLAWQPSPPPDVVSVWLYVTNTSGVPQTYSTDAQMLMDDQGRRFAPTPHGIDHSNTTVDHFDLNPGMTRDNVMIDYAVPPGKRLDQYTLMVHGSHTSIGSPIHLHEVAR
jgi:hypothetical protein